LEEVGRRMHMKAADAHQGPKALAYVTSIVLTSVRGPRGAVEAPRLVT
jgi:hypothetical protein